MIKVKKPRPRLKRLFVYIDICPYCRKKFVNPSKEQVIWNYLQHATSCKKRQLEKKARKKAREKLRKK